MNYLDSKQNEVSQRYLNATGDEFYAGGESMDSKFYGEGMGRQEISSPIIILAENTGTVADTNIELFDALVTGTGATAKITGDNSLVVKTSGIPNVSYERILGGILSGNVYRFNLLRIEVISASTTADSESAAGESIVYSLQSPQGAQFSNPLFPTVSLIQQVKNVRDFQSNILINSDASLKIASIPAGAKIRYYFYPVAMGSATGEMVRGGNAKDYSAPQLNALNF